MACDLCDSVTTEQKERHKPSGAKYCGHEDSCSCQPPKDPGPLGCDDPDGGETSICAPDAKIRELESTFANAKAEADVAEATLQELSQQATELENALNAYRGDEANRRKRAEECKEFIECKKSDAGPDVQKCVETTIDRVCAHIHALEERARYLFWLQGEAQQRVGWVQWEKDRVAAEYNALKDLATKCGTACIDLRVKYDQAHQNHNETRKYLYLLAAKKLHAAAGKCCRDPRDFERLLCDAFDRLFELSKNLRAAKQEEQQTAADLERVKKELKKYQDHKQLWSEIERLVDVCCNLSSGGDPDKPADDCAPQTQAS